MAAAGFERGAFDMKVRLVNRWATRATNLHRMQSGYVARFGANSRTNESSKPYTYCAKIILL
jgi:hypothetical protein